MKKFLCYDTNDAASGKINVDNRGMLKPNSTVPSTNGTPYQQLVTDGNGTAKWEDRLAYDDSKVVAADSYGVQRVKVADEIPSWVSVDSPIKVWTSSGENLTLEPADYLDIGNGSFAGASFAYFIMTDNVEKYGVVFPKKGVYLTKFPDYYVTGIASADSDTPEITWDGDIGELKTIDPKYIPSELNEVILPSSTSGSSKKFKITVDDSGTISATEATY